MTAPRDAASKVAGLAPRSLVRFSSRVKRQIREARVSWRYRRVIMREFGASHSTVMAATADTAVLRVTRQRSPSPLIVKFAASPAATRRQRQEVAALGELASWVGADSSLVAVASLCGLGEHRSGTWYAQTCLEGPAGSTIDVSIEQLVDQALAALRPFHAKTSQTVVPGDDELHALLAGPAGIIARWRPSVAVPIGELVALLDAQLVGRPLTMSRLHGDFAPSNVIWDTARGCVVGIVDWELGPTPLLPEIDNLHFLLSLLRRRRVREYGDVVVSIFEEATSGDAALARAILDSGPNGLDLATGLRLAWLHHAAGGLAKSVGYRHNPFWLVHNVDRVVERLRHDVPPAAATA